MLLNEQINELIVHWLVIIILLFDFINQEWLLLQTKC